MKWHAIFGFLAVLYDGILCIKNGPPFQTITFLDKGQVTNYNLNNGFSNPLQTVLSVLGDDKSEVEYEVVAPQNTKPSNNYEVIGVYEIKQNSEQGSKNDYQYDYPPPPPPRGHRRRGHHHHPPPPPPYDEFYDDYDPPRPPPHDHRIPRNPNRNHHHGHPHGGPPGHNRHPPPPPPDDDFDEPPYRPPPHHHRPPPYHGRPQHRPPPAWVFAEHFYGDKGQDNRQNFDQQPNYDNSGQQHINLGPPDRPVFLDPSKKPNKSTGTGGVVGFIEGNFPVILLGENEIRR